MRRDFVERGHFWKEENEPITYVIISNEQPMKIALIENQPT